MADNDLKQTLTSNGVEFSVVDDFPAKGHRTPRQEAFEAILQMARLREGEVIAIERIGDRKMDGLASSLKEYAAKTGQSTQVKVSSRKNNGGGTTVYVAYNHQG